jgi:hypothetical protein
MTAKKCSHIKIHYHFYKRLFFKVSVYVKSTSILFSKHQAEEEKGKKIVEPF